MRIEHILKKWEKGYGYIHLSKDEHETLSKLKGKRFMIRVVEKLLHQRHIDSKRRIYLSTGPLRTFKVGDRLMILLDDDTLIISKG